uniref:Uncharacterized protein n=4 Tax=Enterobacteriaceae TaxID=543 RepID=T2FKD8_ECOLX|nr:hypothetical protein pHKU1_52 [Escherichia coli]AIW55655.1 hypothetical protein [Klebsiella pneumoniae]AMW88488.1 hypothetical protein [Citrobacter freundii]AVE17877.1 hypothetical protein [Enterobacter hormaechei]AGW01175.1 hypothetical protein [Escherichia coli]
MLPAGLRRSRRLLSRRKKKTRIDRAFFFPLRGRFSYYSALLLAISV